MRGLRQRLRVDFSRVVHNVEAMHGRARGLRALIPLEGRFASACLSAAFSMTIYFASLCVHRKSTERQSGNCDKLATDQKRRHITPGWRPQAAQARKPSLKKRTSKGRKYLADTSSAYSMNSGSVFGTISSMFLPAPPNASRAAARSDSSMIL